MVEKISFLRFISLIFIFELFFTSSFAYAYLDPGIISAFFSMLVAGVVGALVTIKFWWYKFKAFLLEIFKSKNNIGDEKDNK